MADTGWKSSGTITQVASGLPGDIGWTNASNVTASDNSRASVSLGKYKFSKFIKAANLGFSIPTGATIDGIEVAVECYTSNTGSDSDINVAIGQNVATESGVASVEVLSVFYQATPALATTENVCVLGGSTDDWGGVTTDEDAAKERDWTPADFNDSDFGVYIFGAHAGSGTYSYYVDHVKIKVYYTGGGGTTHEVSGTFAATTTFSGTAVRDLGVSGSLPITVSFDGTATIDVPPLLAQGTLAITSTLAGSVVADLSASGILPITIALSGQVVAESGATGTLPITSSLTGAIAKDLGVSGTLPITSTLSGTASFVPYLFAAGILDITTTLSATAVSDLSAAGELSITVDIGGDAIADFVTSGTILINATLTGKATPWVVERGNPETWSKDSINNNTWTEVNSDDEEWE